EHQLVGRPGRDEQRAVALVMPAHPLEVLAGGSVDEVGGRDLDQLAGTRGSGHTQRGGCREKEGSSHLWTSALSTAPPRRPLRRGSGPVSGADPRFSARSAPRGLGAPAGDEALDADQRLADVVQARRVRTADVPFPALAESAAGNDGYP